MTEQQTREMIMLIALFKVAANQQLLIERSELQHKLKQIFNGFINEGNRLYKQLSKEISIDDCNMYQLIDDIEDFIAVKRKQIIIEDEKTTID